MKIAKIIKIYNLETLAEWYATNKEEIGYSVSNEEIVQCIIENEELFQYELLKTTYEIADE